MRAVHWISPVNPVHLACPTYQHLPPAYSPVHAARTSNSLRSCSVLPRTSASSHHRKCSICQHSSSHPTPTPDRMTIVFARLLFLALLQLLQDTIVFHLRIGVGKMIIASFLLWPDHQGIRLVLPDLCQGQFHQSGGWSS